ncbi:hypothetical protein WQ57_22995 [Mesobacillus campisalis]|uniref:DUF4025 domain-containing protein n=1 Tax=Mesobacillus campisalis TaxID=1408103 RepID=A0A0M2SP75_9BACI|nr:hypothetical protein [Mesobacillus campisalis]KKK34420.1 hypothetical protein WQ57_22995 [Mesobacillus campisalis]
MRQEKRKSMDNPEQYPTDKESLHDMFESEQTVDALPVEDLKQEQAEEKNGSIIKDNSSTQEKYKVDYEEK